MELVKTGFTLGRGQDIHMGDLLRSSLTHDVVVMWNSVLNIFIVKIINEDIWFPLDEFISSWGSHLEIVKNILVYE